MDRFRRVRTRKLATYQALLPECVGHHQKGCHATMKIQKQSDEKEVALLVASK